METKIWNVSLTIPYKNVSERWTPPTSDSDSSRALSLQNARKRKQPNTYLQ